MAEPDPDEEMDTDGWYLTQQYGDRWWLLDEPEPQPVYEPPVDWPEGRIVDALHRGESVWPELTRRRRTNGHDLVDG